MEPILKPLAGIAALSAYASSTIGKQGLELQLRFSRLSFYHGLQFETVESSKDSVTMVTIVCG
jgi:hypothetical protein